MCDYSLAGLPTRLAVEGEELVVHRFSTGSLGLTSPTAPLARSWSTCEPPAICVPPGARLLLRNIPAESQQRFGIGAIEEVTFVQLNARAYEYRDAVRFKNGREVLLQWLKCGQQVEVMSLSSVEDEVEHQRFEEQYHSVFIG